MAKKPKKRDPDLDPFFCPAHLLRIQSVRTAVHAADLLPHCRILPAVPDFIRFTWFALICIPSSGKLQTDRNSHIQKCVIPDIQISALYIPVPLHQCASVHACPDPSKVSRTDPVNLHGKRILRHRLYSVYLLQNPYQTTALVNASILLRSLPPDKYRRNHL